MYTEHAIILGDAARVLRQIASRFREQGEPFMAERCDRHEAELMRLLDPAVPCCEYRRAGEEINRVLETADTLRSLLPKRDAVGYVPVETFPEQRAINFEDDEE